MSEGALGAQWAALRQAGRVGLIPYLTAGYPSAAVTRDALMMVQDQGADVIELGLPFSDPLADGPVIQRASQRALEGGMTAARALDLLAEVRPVAPVVIFSYLNPILQYGVERFVRDASGAGAAAVLLTDLPAGTDPALEGTVRRGGLDLIQLVAPTTTLARLDVALRSASGFVYLIARTGVTGRRTDIGTAVERRVAEIRERTALPVAVGFGIASGEQARRVARFADGVVVGSALVDRLAAGLSPARELMIELRRSLDAVPVA